MILAIDVHYKTERAKSVGVLFKQWNSEVSEGVLIGYVSEVKPYVTGAFYKRELPCILELLKRVDLKQINCIVIDGFVLLDDNNKLGLGGYLYKHLNETIPVIGVAKSTFHRNKLNVVEVYRGQSKKPLYITALGIDKNTAAEYIKSMSGPNRMPGLLRKLDQITKED